MPRTVKRILLIVAAFALFVVPAAAIAAAGFTDVADSSLFVSDIQWMKDNDITRGCNPPTNDRYCPGNNVTREQMSAFMHRLAVNQVVDAATAIEADHATTADTAIEADHATTADTATTAGSATTAGTASDADTLDGRHATAIAPVAVAQVDETLIGATVTVPTTTNSVSITVESSGVLIISGGAYISANETGLYGIETYVGGTEVGEFSAFDSFSAVVDDDDDAESMSYTTAAAVTPGTYVVRQRLGKFNSGTGDLVNGSFFYNANSMSVLFVPGGTVTAVPAGSASGGTLDGS